MKKHNVLNLEQKC